MSYFFEEEEGEFDRIERPGTRSLVILVPLSILMIIYVSNSENLIEGFSCFWSTKTINEQLNHIRGGDQENGSRIRPRNQLPTNEISEIAPTDFRQLYTTRDFRNKVKIPKILLEESPSKIFSKTSAVEEAAKNKSFSFPRPCSKARKSSLTAQKPGISLPPT